MEMIEVRPLRPFVGTFKCAMADADFIDDDFTEKDGAIVKVKTARKRVIGMISTARRLTAEERASFAKGQPLPDRAELADDGATLVMHPPQRTVRVPSDLAASLIDRGLAEAVSTKRSRAA